MRQPVRLEEAKREHHDTADALAAIGFLAVIVGVSVAFLRDGELGVLILIPGAVIAAAAMAYMYACFPRRWITPDDDGFEYFDGKTNCRIRDGEVTAFSVAPGFGTTIGWGRSALCRRGSIRVRGQDFQGEIPFTYSFEERHPDPLGELCERLHTRVSEEARGELADGGQLSGDGWAMEAGHFVYESVGTRHAVPLDQLAKVDTFQGHLRIWRHGQGEPFLMVSLAGRNGAVLRDLLTAQLARTSATASTHRFGRVLHEFDESKPKPKMGPRYAGAAVCGLILLGGVWVAVGPMDKPEVGGIVGVLAGLLGFICLVPTEPGQVRILRCHERGLHFYFNGAVQEVAFESAEWLTCKMTRIYFNNAYSNTLYEVEIGAANGSRFKYLAHDAGDTLDRVREYVSRILAQRGLERLGRGERVPWGRQLHLTPDGLEVAGTVGREARRFPLTEVGDVTLDQGRYSVAVGPGRDRRVVSGSLDERDFFPGLILLAVLKEVGLPGIARRQRDEEIG